MPRKRILKTNRVHIDENIIKSAVISVFNNTYSERRASIIFDIKRSTLQSRIKKILTKYTKDEYIRKHQAGPENSENESDQNDSPKYSSKYTVHQIFTIEEEHELEKYIKRRSDMNYGLTYNDIQKLAYDYARVLNKTYPVQWDRDKCARKGWRIGFMNRHKSLSLRKPESTSLNRATAFTKCKVEQFFENYKNILNRFKFPPERIFNIDETGVTTVMRPVKIVSTCGRKAVSQVASAERGELTTILGIINAAGQSLPPVYVFPRIRYIHQFLTEAPVSSIALGNKSGWMTSDLFPEVLKHIVIQTNCNPANPILILLDNHESHVTLNVIKYARDNGICLLSFPPHTTHRLQPLDVGVFGPFKSFCAVSFNDWLTSNPGQTISVKNIPQLTNLPYQKAFTPSNILNSFKKTGLWPLNRLIFSDDDFAPSYVTDRPRPNNTENIEEVVAGSEIGMRTPKKIVEEQEANPMDVPTQTSNEKNSHETPSCSKTSVDNAKKKIFITPEAVRPYPKAERKCKRIRKEPGKSRIYTDTPEKNRLEELEREKEIKKQKCEEMKKRRAAMKNELGNKKILTKNKIKDKTDSSSESDVSMSVHDESSDDLSDELESLKELTNETLNPLDFVLVRFPVKNTMVHFVGQILAIDETGALRIKFLRRKGLSSTFYFPTIDDLSNIDADDIVAKLLLPSRSGTARTASYFTFQYNFGNLVVN